MLLKQLYENSMKDVLQGVKSYILNIDMSKYIYNNGNELLYSEDGLYIEIYSDVASTNVEQFKNILVENIFPIFDRYWKYFEEKESFAKNESDLRVEIQVSSFNDARFTIEYTNSNMYIQLDSKFIKKLFK